MQPEASISVALHSATLLLCTTSVLAAPPAQCKSVYLHTCKREGNRHQMSIALGRSYKSRTWAIIQVVTGKVLQKSKPLSYWAIKTLTSWSLFLRFYCVTMCCRFEHFRNFFNVLFCTFNLKFVLEVQHPFMFWVYTGCFLPLLYNTLMKALCQDMLMEQREDSSSKSAQHLLVNKAINEVLHYIRLLKISDVTCCCVWLDWKAADWTFSSLEGTSCIITTALAFRALIMGRQSKQKCIHTTESGSKSLFTEESAGFHSLTGGKKINSVPRVTQLIWCGADSSG